ncbi:MAG: hypothetical protein HQ472_06150 [Ignavibacteria bacterium]|nr:hypothetical protein [Ignavibacteria bacterium]
MTSVNLGSTPLIAKMQKVGFALIVLGALGLAAVFITGGQERFFADYLLGFWFFTGISVTMLFFSALQYLTRAGWSVSVRRTAENFTGMVPYVALFAAPIIYNLFSHHSIYEWSHESAATDHLLVAKSGYLNTTFFIVRIGIYCLLWFGMLRFLVGNSVKQDSNASDITPTRKNWKRAAPWVIVYALSITFCSFDLLMSLEPHWFSTMWGVYTFAGHFVASISVLALMTIWLYKAGLLRQYITSEQFHDLGKLMFAFSSFWAYIAFSQYFIIWYANLPEETIYFEFRMHNQWEIWGYILIVSHFVAPFIVLLRQDVKRKMNFLIAGAVIVLFSHFVDLAWIIIPAVSKVAAANSGEQFTMGWQELTGWLFFAGVFLLLAVQNYKKRSAVPIGDPLLQESVHYNS